MIKLNIGCGFDYRDGFINIDGSDKLPKVDMIIDFDSHSILEYFSEGEVDFILANDFIEHHFHFRAIDILQDFFITLKPNGILQMRLPDFETTLRLLAPLTSEQKITMLYGGQDVPQGKGDEDSRTVFPHFYCHKYAYKQISMKTELERIGFVNIATCPEYENTMKTRFNYFLARVSSIVSSSPKFGVNELSARANFVVTAQKPRLS